MGRSGRGVVGPAGARGQAGAFLETLDDLVQTRRKVRRVVQLIEDRQGFKIGCIEEIAWRRGFIDDARLEALAKPLQKSGYGDYLLGLLEDRSR